MEANSVDAAAEAVADQPAEEWLDELTPRQIVAELDKYIVGQTDAKRAVAIALRNRWRRQRVDDEPQRCQLRHDHRRQPCRRVPAGRIADRPGRVPAAERAEHPPEQQHDRPDHRRHGHIVPGR